MTDDTTDRGESLLRCRRAKNRRLCGSPPLRGKADFYLSSRIATRPAFPGRVLCCLVNYTIRCNSEKRKLLSLKSAIVKLPHNKKDIPQRKTSAVLLTEGRRKRHSGRRPRRPAPPLFHPPSVNAPFAFSCGRRGTALRWMRSNALPSAKPHLREKRLIRQPLAATFSHRRRHICTPACSCLLLSVAKRHEGSEFHSGGVKEPECARAAARQGNREAVDEECELSSADLSVKTPSALSPPVGVGAPDDPQRSLARRPLVNILPFASQLCLLLREKGDREAVDEE